MNRHNLLKEHLHFLTAGGNNRSKFTPSWTGHFLLCTFCHCSASLQAWPARSASDPGGSEIPEWLRRTPAGDHWPERFKAAATRWDTSNVSHVTSTFLVRAVINKSAKRRKCLIFVVFSDVSLSSQTNIQHIRIQDKCTFLSFETFPLIQLRLHRMSRFCVYSSAKAHLLAATCHSYRLHPGFLKRGDLFVTQTTREEKVRMRACFKFLLLCPERVQKQTHRVNILCCAPRQDLSLMPICEILCIASPHSLRSFILKYSRDLFH